MKTVTKKNKVYIVFGCGGTGSWLASFLSKLDNKNVVLVDGDIVERKNIGRQSFREEDIGSPKARAVAFANGFNIFVEKFIDSKEIILELISQAVPSGSVPVFVGCLDNNASRHLLHECFQELKDIVWIDSGNAERTGQCYVAMKEAGEVIYPSPIDIDEAFARVDGDERRPDQISCAEQSASAPQNVTANVMAATVVFNVINVLETNGALFGNKYTFDTVFNVVDSTENI